MKYLERLQPKAKQLDLLMKRRRNLIQVINLTCVPWSVLADRLAGWLTDQKMVDFEKTASDPKRPFRASFQLLEEEKFRRTCSPTLRRLDESLLKAIQDFERASAKPFMLGNRRYRDTLVKKKKTLTDSVPFLYSPSARSTTHFIIAGRDCGQKSKQEVLWILECWPQQKI